MSLGQKITKIRKEKKLSQVDVASYVGVSRDAISKYERDDNSPSIEMALKIAKVFDISVDYLLGEGKHASFDKETLKRLEDIENLDPNTRATLFNVIDTFLRDAKARNTYA